MKTAATSNSASAAKTAFVAKPVIAKATAAPPSTVLVASGSESDSDDDLTPLSKLAEKKGWTNQHARNGNGIDDIPLALLKKL